MIEIKSQNLIYAPQQTVWNALIEPDQIPQWCLYATKVEYPLPPQMGGIRSIIRPRKHIKEEILVFRPPSVLSVRQNYQLTPSKKLFSPPFFQDTWELDPIDHNKTAVKWSTRFSKHGFLGMLLEQTITRFSLKDRIKQNLDRLKQYLEGFL